MGMPLLHQGWPLRLSHHSIRNHHILMSWLGDQGIVTLQTILFSLFTTLLAFIIEILRKQWWTPTRLQNSMRLQGIEGPSYRFVCGNTQEISELISEVRSNTTPYTIFSHNTLFRVQPHIHSWTKRYGKVYLQWKGCQAQLVVMEPELCIEILENKEGTFSKLNPQGYVKKLKGDGLPRSVGAKWVNLRKLANHAYNGESLKRTIPAMIASTQRMLERWENHEGNEIDVFEEFKLLSSEVFSKAVFGSSYLEGLSIFERTTKIWSILFKHASKLERLGISKFFRTKDMVESEKLDKEMCDIILEIAKKQKKNAMATGDEEKNTECGFLGLLLKASQDPNGKRISEQDLVNECKTFFFAGHETVTALTWTVFLLALHTDWQEKARTEILQVFGMQTPHADKIFKLKTLSMIINESLRLYPPVVSMVRKVEREVKLGKLIVPADVELLIPILALHHDPQLWGQDVELFKPDRFSEGVAKATRNNKTAFLPFGMGPRTCAGFNFATTEVKIMTSMILQRHSITISPTYVHSPREFHLLQPQHGVQVVLHSL